MSTSEASMNGDVEGALAAVSQIDLAPINRKLQHEDPDFWTEETVAEAEAMYRQFLALNLLLPDTPFAVNKILDDYWHQHILDTSKYAADCQTIFGKFLHHYPNVGIEGDEDREENLEVFALTQQIWQETFGSSMTGAPKLTLDKILGGYQSAVEGVAGREMYVFPEGCKNGQHCKKIIVPGEIELDLPVVAVLASQG
jgi:hypothetical protein